MDRPWQIQLLGGLQAQQEDRLIARFQTKKTGLLLAYLALHQDRVHAREALAALFWPEAKPGAGTLSLRVALNSLRSQLEPPNAPKGCVLIADQTTVQINTVGVTTDVAAFNTALRRARGTTNAAMRIDLLRQAAELYHGELLYGYYDDWILAEREHLAETYRTVLTDLNLLLEQTGDPAQALNFALRAVAADPLREESHQDLIRLYLLENRPTDALSQYHRLERILKEELGDEPGEETRRLVTGLMRSDVSAARTSGARTRQIDPAPPPISLPQAPQQPAKVEASQPDISALGSAFPPSRLPLQFTRFFGRASDIERLQALLTPGSPEHTRLVILTGAGGSGKTRLAIEAAGKLNSTFRDAVWFVPLADLSDPMLISTAIAAALQLPRAPAIEPLEQIVKLLNGAPTPRRPVLLVLDNMEHLQGVGTPDGAAIVQILLERVPGLVCLVTSRRCLQIMSEQEFPVLPLPVPQADAADGSLQVESEPTASSLLPLTTASRPPSTLLSFASVRLFVDRAQRVHPDFQVTARNAATIARICEQLEGVPLAIELAAAWARTLTPAQMLTRLSRRFDLLVSRHNDREERHRTLWATIEWGYQLLSPELQRLFARLHVFRGGWTLEAASTILAQTPHAAFDTTAAAGPHNAPSSLPVSAPLPPGNLSEDQLLASMEELRVHSFVLAVEQDEQVRWQMLETLREFAAERLSEAERRELSERHARYYLHLAEQAALQLQGAQRAMIRRQLDIRRDNLHAALEWTLDHAPELGLRLAAALWQYWALCGLFQTGRAWQDCALRATTTSIPARIAALNGAGVLAQLQGDFQVAQDHFQQTLRLSRDSENRYSVATALSNLGSLAYSQGDYDSATRYSEECLVIWREYNEQQRIALALNNLGIMAREQEQYERATALLEESLLLKRGLNDRQGIATTLNNLGLVAHDREDYAVARAFHEEALTINSELDNRAMLAINLHNLGRTLTAEADYEHARQLFTRSLTIRREIGDRAGIAYSLEGVAELAAVTANPEQATRLYGAASALREEIGAPLPHTDLKGHRQAQDRACMALGEQRYHALLRLGRTMSLEQAVEYAKTSLIDITNKLASI
jgi:predicted ATPase/DNA-binding SARP family transcriptional activator